MLDKTRDSCEVCSKITCKECGWEANDKDVEKIQSGLLTACPTCGWEPR